MNASELAAELADRCKDGEDLKLAAEGLAKQRSPSVGGPSWAHASGSLTANSAKEAIPKLETTCGNKLADFTASLKTHEMLEGVIYLDYATSSLRSSGEELVRVRSENTAMILLDYVDQVSTVSARTDEDALFIGASWAEATASDVSPVKLTFDPALAFPPLSPRSVRMLEAIYGRIDSAASVINVDRISTRRQDPDSPVQDQMARGHANHVLIDGDVRGCLTRGDDITGLAFQVDWPYTSKKKQLNYISHVTLDSESGPLILRATRAGHSFELASSLYQALRRALAKPTASSQMDTLKEHLKEATGKNQ